MHCVLLQTPTRVHLSRANWVLWIRCTPNHHRHQGKARQRAIDDARAEAAAAGVTNVTLLYYIEMNLGPEALPPGAAGCGVYGTFRLNFHRFHWFELNLRGHTQPWGAALSCLRLK